MNYRQKANFILAAVFFFFILSLLINKLYPEHFYVKMFYFIMEAALVGGIADWFAVTALFKKPLGWPYHTALIPRNRSKIIDSVSQMVQQELMGMTLIKGKLAEIDYSRNIIHWIDQINGVALITDKLADYLHSQLIKADPSEISKRLSLKLRTLVLNVDLAPYLGRFLETLIEKKRHEPFIEKSVDKLIQLVQEEQTKTSIYNFLNKQKEAKLKGNPINRFFIELLEKSGGLNLLDASEALQSQIVLHLSQLKNSHHPVHRLLTDKMGDLAARLKTDSYLKEKVNDWKNHVFTEIPLDHFLEDIIKDLSALTLTQKTEIPPLIHWLSLTLSNFWEDFKVNFFFQNQFNNYVKEALSYLIEKEHNSIGNIVRESLETLSDENLNEFIENKAGNDLQWIRINGSIIGGLVGLLIFIFLNFLYDPYILPYLTRLLG